MDMPVTHNISMPILISIADDELEITAEIEYTIKPGTPDSWTDPGDPAEIEYGKIEIKAFQKDGLTAVYPKFFSQHGDPPVETVISAPDWLADFISNSDAVYEACGEASGWGENDGPDPDDEYERRRDDYGQGV